MTPFNSIIIFLISVRLYFLGPPACRMLCGRAWPWSRPRRSRPQRAWSRRSRTWIWPRPSWPGILSGNNSWLHRKTLNIMIIGNIVFQYGYKVHDDYHKTNFGHNEKRDGKHTSGEYYVHLPDGRIQHVKYHVDGYKGYVADVSYSKGGHVHAPKPHHGHGGGYHWVAASKWTNPKWRNTPSSLNTVLCLVWNCLSIFNL